MRAESERLYNALTELGYAVLLDDRNERPGVKFADIDLMGIPHRLVVGDRGLAEGVLEYKSRRETETRNIPLSDAEQFIRDTLPRRS